MPPPTAGRLSDRLQRCAPAGALRLGAQALVGGHLPHASLEIDLVCVPRARDVFDAMPSPSMHAYNIHLATSPLRVALDLLSRLLAAGVRPDLYAVHAALRACAELPDPLLGAALHGFAVQLDFLANVVVSGALLDTYAKAGLLEDAVRVLDEMPDRDAVVWNCMVSADARAGKEAATLELFRRAQVEVVNMARDLRAVPTALNVYRKDGELMKGMGIHGRMVRFLAFDRMSQSGTRLIDMYAKYGRVDVSKVMFAGMQERTVVSWSTLIRCYGVHGKGEEALRVYEEMVSQGMKLNCVNFMEIAAYRLFELEGNVSNCITLSSIYDAVGRSDGVAGLRSRMRELGMVKTPGCSCVDVKGRAHSYKGSISHGI